MYHGKQDTKNFQRHNWRKNEKCGVGVIGSTLYNQYKGNVRDDCTAQNLIDYEQRKLIEGKPSDAIQKRS